MEKYEKYKDSGVEWIGIIPEHWQVCDFKRLATRIEVGIAEAATQAYVEEKGVPILRSTNIKRGIIQGELLEISQEFAEKNNSKKIFKNDLVTVRTGNAGLTAVIPEYLDGCQCFTLLVTSLKAEQDPHFYNYFLNSEIGEFQFSLSAWGTAQKNISVPILGYTKVIFPPKIEQTAIVNYLDKKTSELDTLITKKEKLIELLKEERTAIINQAVTKGLDPNVEMKDSGLEWLGEIPAHWEVKKLKYVVKAVKTGTTPPSDFLEYFEPGDIDWFTPSDFYQSVLNNSRRKVSAKAIQDSKCQLFPKNSVFLIGIGATLGKLGIITEKASCNQQINAIIFDEDLYSPYFGLYFLNKFSEIIVSMASSATLAILNQTQTKDLWVVQPTLKEQTAIVNHILQEEERIFFIISKTEQEIILLKEYKTALISEVVTGKVKVV